MPVTSLRLIKDSGASSTDNITSIDTLTGIASSGALITFTINGVAIGTATADPSGSFVFAPSGLADGTYRVVASVPGSSVALTFTLDTTAPVVTERLTTDTGVSSTDHITSNPALTGTGAAGAIVTLVDGATVLGTTKANNQGVWSFTPTGLAQGAHTIVASQTDTAGNIGSAALTFTLDSVAPVVSESLLADTGASATDRITANPALTGKATANSVVTLREGNTVRGTTTADASGNWSFAPTGLSQGSHTIIASETDIAGNTGTASLTFTLDNVAPAVTAKLVGDTGASSTDKITSNSALTGGGDASASVTLTLDGTNVFTTTANKAGTWTFTPANLGQGAHTVVASETDLAGNTGTTSLTFTLDSIAPAVTEGLVADTGASATDKITANPAMIGTTAPNSVVTLREGIVVIGTTTADASGNWTFTPTSLSQGAHTIQARATDIAGNTGTASLSFTLDSVAPAVTEVLANDTGTPGDNITNDPTLTGTADPRGTVVLTEDATAVGSATADATGHWTFTPTNLAQGSHTILASDTDLAGNIGTASLTFALQNGRTISNTTTGPVNLTNPAADNPLVITSTGAVNSAGPGIDGIDGTSAAAWTITNDGTVASAGGQGISLAGAGVVSNGPTSHALASISGSTNGIRIVGGGTVTNWGVVSGNEAVALLAGGSVSNKAGGTLSASGAVGGGFASGAGVYTAHAYGSVTNDGTIAGGAYGVAMAAGGSVTNTASITGGEDGVIVTGAGGTLANSGRIVATVDDGVGIFAGGSVTNAAGALIQGAGSGGAGVFITGAAGTVSNSGSITTTGTRFGVLLTGGGSVTNNAAASITGVLAAVLFNGHPGNLYNAGTITASGPAAADLEAGGGVVNQNGGTISGYEFGVFITNGAGTVTNSGAIDSAKYGAVNLTTGGTVTNTAGGSIAGGTSGIHLGAFGTVTNAGSVNASSAGGSGVYLSNGGDIVNNVLGAFTGAAFGIFATNAAATVTNNGTITGPHGIGLQAGGSVTNDAGGAILGQAAGISTTGGSATVVNAGSISATAAGGAALDIEGGGSITNLAGGTVAGASFGVFVAGGSGTVANDGSIAGTGNIGIDLAGGGTVTNAAGASISAGGFGVAVYGLGGTVTNAGTISGSISAVHFGAGTTNDLLVVDPGAVFNGNVVGGGGANTLELAQGTAAGSIGGIGSSFAGFGSVTVDSGASWTLGGSNTAGTVLNNGSLSLASAGSLDVTTAIDPASAGQFDLASSSVLEIAAAIGSGAQIAFLGTAQAIVDTASVFGSNVGLSTYSGPVFDDFGLGDTIDLKNVSFAGVTLDYASATGLLQVDNGGTNVASLLFQTSSLVTGTFNVADDGTGHSLITIT